MKAFPYVFLIFAMGYLFSSCKKESTQQPLRVEYSINCADCFVVCYDENGNEKSWYNQNDSFSYGFNGEKGDVLLLVAHNTSSGPAAVTGRIKVNGANRKERTSYCPINGTVIVTDTLQ